MYVAPGFSKNDWVEQTLAWLYMKCRTTSIDKLHNARCQIRHPRQRSRLANHIGLDFVTMRSINSSTSAQERCIGALIVLGASLHSSPVDQPTSMHALLVIPAQASRLAHTERVRAKALLGGDGVPALIEA